MLTRDLLKKIRGIEIVTDMAPVVGVPMPLLSYGGTVLLTVMIGFGLVQAVRVHRYSEVTSGKGALL